MRIKLLTSSILALSVAAPTVLAHQAGDMIVRAGVVTVTTGESTSGVIVNGTTDLGGEATLNNNTQLGLNFAYMVTNKVAVELLGASPFEHDVAIKGTGAVDGGLGKVKHLPPTLSAVYFPMDAGSAFQPYVGVGVNYTWFFDEETTASAESNTPSLTNLKVKNSWGSAAQAGADYMLTENIMLNGQIRYIDIDTEATVDVAGGAAHAKVDVNIKPVVYMVGLGYKF